MLELVRKARLGAVLLGTCVLLAACSDDDDGPSGPAGSFDAGTAEATADAAASVVVPVTSDPNLTANLTFAQSALFGFGGFPGVALPLEAMNDVQARLDGGVSLPSMSLALSPQMGPIVPDDWYGSTYVYNVETGEYVVDESATGAPSTGIRVVYYAVDPTGAGAHPFATPLNPLGHIDFTDESTAGTYRLTVEVVSSSAGTLADYFVQASGNETAGDVEAEGYFDFDERIDFDLHMGGSETATGVFGGVDFLIENDSENASLHLLLNDATESSTNVQVSDVTFTVEHGSNVAVFAAEQTFNTETSEGSITGALTFNGEEVVLLSGNPANPTFTSADGGNLTQREIGALGQMWSMYALTLLVGIQVLFPFLLGVAI